MACIISNACRHERCVDCIGQCEECHERCLCTCHFTGKQRGGVGLTR